jgi:hypothetical protein
VAHAVDDFRVFGSIAAQAVGALYVHRPVEGSEENALLLREHTPPMVAQLADLLAPEAARFLLAHEVGHICLDHFARGHPSLLALHPDAPSRAVSAFDHELEFEADAWAAETTLQVAGDDVQRQTLAVVTPLLFFAMMAFVDRLHTTTNPLGQTLRASHPSAHERLRRRWRFASEQTHIPPNDAMKLMVEICRFVEERAPAPD